MVQCGASYGAYLALVYTQKSLNERELGSIRKSERVVS